MAILGLAIAQLLGMRFTDCEVHEDRVTYRYIGLGILARESVASLKAKILQLAVLPADVPVEVRVEPTKRGLITKEYTVEVDVKRRGYNLK